MSIGNFMEISKNLFNLEQIGPSNETNNTLIFEEITRELKTYLLEDSDNADSTDDIFDFVTLLADQVQGGFEKLLGSNSNKKRFLRAFSNVLALLLNAKVDTAEKILKKKYLNKH